jgi:hypothetical protein
MHNYIPVKFHFNWTENIFFELSWLPWRWQPFRKCQTLNVHIQIRDEFFFFISPQNFYSLRVQAWGMGDNSIFIVFSNLWSSVHLKTPLNSKLLDNRDCLHWIWAVKIKRPLFLLPFYSCAHVVLYLIAANKSVSIICLCSQNIIEISLSRKNCHRNMLSKLTGV